LASILCSTFAQIEFLVPVADVPDDYLTRKTRAWQLAPDQVFEWEDEKGRGASDGSTWDRSRRSSSIAWC
jgi:hypothetical protein